jgi:hypothetical protein
MTALVIKMPKVTKYATILAIFEKALTVAALANEPVVSLGGLVRNGSQAFLSSSLEEAKIFKMLFNREKITRGKALQGI